MKGTILCAVHVLVSVVHWYPSGDNYITYHMYVKYWQVSCTYLASAKYTCTVVVAILKHPALCLLALVQ